MGSSLCWDEEISTPFSEVFCGDINIICADHNLLTCLTSQVPYLLVLSPLSSTPHIEILEERSIPIVSKPAPVSLWPYPACCAGGRWPGISKLAFFFSQQFSQNSFFLFFYFCNTLRLFTVFCFFSPKEAQLCLASYSRPDLVRSKGYNPTSRHNALCLFKTPHLCQASRWSPADDKGPHGLHTCAAVSSLCSWLWVNCGQWPLSPWRSHSQVAPTLPSKKISSAFWSGLLSVSEC